jgi:hypothetical protein
VNNADPSAQIVDLETLKRMMNRGMEMTSQELVEKGMQAVEQAGDRTREPGVLVAALGESAVGQLRRYYFPRWRPGVVLQPNPELRRFRRVVVEDEREVPLVEAVAPDDMQYRVALEADFPPAP